METKITFRNMDSSEALRAHINKQMQKVITFLENERLPLFIDMVLEPSKRRAHNRAEVRVKTPHYDLISNYEGQDLYDVIDRVIDVMYHEILEAKRKRVDGRKRGKLSQ
jgi:ribosomal subunit interface protein